MNDITLVRAATLVASPWKNGGGVTREVAASPEGAGFGTFAWRVSIADVAAPGPFSRFAGIDRTLVLLAGAGMLLDAHSDVADTASSGTQTHALEQPLDVVRFAGEALIDARLVNGPTRDFNLMVRRGVATATLDVWRGNVQHELSGDTVLLFCAAGPMRVTLRGMAPVELSIDDTVRIDRAHALHVSAEGEGALLAVTVRHV
jgi:environmental stress-induced protein Ves